MGISLSGGPWQYNRFNLAEASKPDYLDFDKDGDKKEPMKKALKEKGGKKCPKCGKSPCECGKSDMKEWVEEMVQEGIDLSEYTWDDMIEIFNEGSDIRYPKKEDIKSFTKRKDDPKVAAGRKAAKEMGLKMNEATIKENRRAARAAGGYVDDSKKQTDPSKDGFTGISGSIKEIMRQNKEIEAKNKVKKEEVCYYLMSEGFANNPVSAEIMFNHMSEEWLDAIEERWVGRHGQFDTEYADSRSPAGKMISGDSKRSGAEYTHGRRVKAANPGMQPDVGGKTKPKSQGRMDKATRADLAYRKANLKKKN